MPDIITNTNSTTENPSPVDANKQELDTQMALALGNGIPPTAQPAPYQAPVPAIPKVEIPTEIIVPTFEIIKEKFGYEKPEDAIKEIEDLRAFKATPPPAAEIKYADEKSERLAKAWMAGKKEEVYNVLKQEVELERYSTVEVTKENAADIIKLGMQIANPKLTTQEIEFQYKQDFTPPKEPVQKSTEDDEEFAERQREWKERVENIEMKRSIAAKIAQPQLELHKSKLTLPEITAQVDEDYSAWKQSRVDADKRALEATEFYKTVTPNVLETKLNFNDEANKIAFEFQYQPDDTTLVDALEVVLSPEKYKETFTNQDGTPNRKKFLETLYFGLNKDKILLEAMKQSKNATLKAFLPDNGGVVRQMPQTQEPNELHENMRRAGVVR